jgi:hypothetical protein
MKKNVIAIVVIMGAVAWSCQKSDTGNNGLKQSVENGVASINNAVNKISGTPGYQLLSLNDISARSDMSFADTITLADVAGIYDFQPDTVMRMHMFNTFRLFKKTGVSDNMVVNLPEQMIMHPRHMEYYEPLDTVYPNNFTITATDYHIYLNWWHSFEYKLTAGMTLNGNNAGNMDVFATAHSEHSNAYHSKYNFNDGYSIGSTWQDGDTATSSFFLAKDNDTLFMEKNMFVRQYYHKAEKYYDLTIGAVELKKSANVDSLQVFVGGVMQQHAAEIITNDSDTTGSVCHKRDILLTFDDGTTEKLSVMLAPVKDQLKSLQQSLHDMFFARRIVDYITSSIFYEDHQYHN